MITCICKLSNLVRLMKDNQKQDSKTRLFLGKYSFPVLYNVVRKLIYTNDWQSESPAKHRPLNYNDWKNSL